MQACYSGTPLAKKLGIAPAQRVLLLGAPASCLEVLALLPPGVVFETEAGSAIDLVQWFVTDRDELAQGLADLRRRLRPDAALWISWPKKSAKLPTTITEDVIRELALPLGFVDVKVCAVDAVWSGLKLVVRKELR